MEVDSKEWQTKENLRRFLAARFLVRLHISVLLLAAIAAGWIANRALFLLGVDRLLTRHVIAVIAAYCAFVLGVGAWIRLSGIREYLHWRKSREMLDPQQAQAGPPGSPRWDWVGSVDPTGAVLGGEGCLVVLVVLVLLVLLMGIGGYLIVDAASFFAEIVFELLLAAGLVRRMRKLDPPSWTGGVVRRTLPALIITLLLVAGFGLWAQARYPEANTIAAVLKKMGSDSTMWRDLRKRY